MAILDIEKLGLVGLRKQHNAAIRKHAITIDDQKLDPDQPLPYFIRQFRQDCSPPNLHSIRFNAKKSPRKQRHHAHLRSLQSQPSTCNLQPATCNLQPPRSFEVFLELVEPVYDYVRTGPEQLLAGSEAIGNRTSQSTSRFAGDYVILAVTHHHRARR